jgi:hypothetical protein
MNTETTTIEVDHSTAVILQALKAKAESQGVSLAHLLESLAEEIGPEPGKTFFERTPEERAQALLQWVESRRITAPPLSDEAISRESIYGEREDGQL